MPKTWLITGCSSGFGKELTEAVLARGDRLVATARKLEALDALASRYPETVRTAALDVTREGDAAAAVRLAQDAFGGLDVLVNNAGFGFVAAIEEGAPDEYRPMFETNVFGLIRRHVQHCQPYARAGGASSTSPPSAALSGARAWASTTPPSSRWKACPRRWRKRSSRSGLR